MTRRRVNTALLAILCCVATVFAMQSFFISGDYLSLVAAVLLGTLLMLHLRHWRWSPEATVVTLTLLTVWGSPPDYVRTHIMLSALIPVVVAAALLSWRWTIVVFVSILSLMVVRTAAGAGTLASADLGPTFEFENLLLMGTIVGEIAVASAAALHAQRTAEMNAQRAEAALLEVAQQTRDLERQVAIAQRARLEAEAAQAQVVAQFATIEEQRAVIREMGIPVLPLSTTTMLMPLIGALDSGRLLAIQEAALAALERSRARLLILDITGVPVIDSHVAPGFIEVMRSAKLLGAKIILVGIRPEVAQAIVGLGVVLENIVTRSTLEDGIAYTLRSRKDETVK